MEVLITELTHALENKMYYTALTLGLIIPDICGAMQEEDGKASGERYKQWFKKYVEPKYDNAEISADIYDVRCAMLHQGKIDHDRKSYDKVFFHIPQLDITIGRMQIENSRSFDLKSFLENIISGYETWHEEYKDDSNYIANSEKSVKYYPDGISPYVSGMPIIG